MTRAIFEQSLDENEAALQRILTNMVSCKDLAKVGQRLTDKENSLTDRFRALFTLRNLGGKEAIDYIANTFDDPSALLKHELAFCLGQMQDRYAVPVLVKVLEDKVQDTMVRHEAAEALGAIGDPSIMEILQRYSNDPAVEVAETCQLAIGRIKWLQEKKLETEKKNPYCSVDPAPPADENDINMLKETLLDESKTLFDRYRAMFSLRNKNTEESVLILAEGLKCSSALFRHEIAYVLGQMQHQAAIKGLSMSLSDKSENPMVRHECAEALGSIAKENCIDILKEYLKDNEQVVNESCKVALDMYEYETTSQFQYANGLEI